MPSSGLCGYPHICLYTMQCAHAYVHAHTHTQTYTMQHTHITHIHHATHMHTHSPWLGTHEQPSRISTTIIDILSKTCIRVKIGEMDQSTKCFLCKYEDLKWIPSTHVKSQA